LILFKAGEHRQRLQTLCASKDRVIRVASLVYPEPDVNKLIKALLALARELQATEREKDVREDAAADHEVSAA
jgi:hypothetical protein